MRRSPVRAGLIPAVVTVLLTTVAAGCTTPRATAPHRTTAAPGTKAQAATPPPTHPTDPPARGRLVRLPIPGKTSGFTARPAYVYLPPAALKPSPAKLPLLELLHGTPGSPSDWTTRGGLLAQLDALSAAQGGAAPITVLPDINGSRQGDSECIRAGNADIEEYLTADVPDFVASRYPVSADHRRWAIAGISEGGTCSVMLALRHPRLFSVFADLSGLARPTLGDTDDPQSTIRGLFGGSVAAYDQHDPLWLLRTHRYPTLRGWFSYGARETTVALDIRAVAAMGKRAGVQTRVVVIPGGHSWPTWSAAMQRLLPWLRSRVNP